MQQKTIDLQPVFVMNNHYLVKNLQECFNKLNTVLQNKTGVRHQPLFAKEENGVVNIGYIQREKGTCPFFSNEKFDDTWETLERICLAQFVIFEGCKHYDCYTEVPMAGAPEEGDDAFFKFTLDDTGYTYKLWTKK